MTRPRIYADFNKLDRYGRLCLTCRGTSEDLKRLKIELCEGLHVTFYTDDADAQGNLDELEVDGIVHYDKETGQWVGEFALNAIKHVSESRKKKSTD
jgi:hypothetical protein